MIISFIKKKKSAETFIGFSTEDSEPVYDQLHLDRCQSDSEGDRASSASPPNCDNPYSTVAGEEVYSEIAPRDTEQLLKSSQVKSRRNMYAGEWMDGAGVWSEG